MAPFIESGFEAVANAMSLSVAWRDLQDGWHHNEADQASHPGQSNRTFHYSIVRSRGLLFGCLRQVVLPAAQLSCRLARGQANKIK
jgi:hypothetical protein